MKTIKAIFALTALVAAISHAQAAAVLDQDSATVNMDIGRYASLTGLDDFRLTTNDPDGSAGAVYSGNDQFDLESNAQVRVSLEGGDLSNGKDSVSTAYDMDGNGIVFETAADSVHDGKHVVSASAKLGAISAQKAGAYSSKITLTVSAL